MICVTVLCIMDVKYVRARTKPYCDRCCLNDVCKRREWSKKYREIPDFTGWMAV